MNIYRIGALMVLLLGMGLGYFVGSGFSQSNTTLPFKLGLDLVGGTQLLYQADVSEIDDADIPDSMQALRGVLERRLNPVGTSEVSVITESASIFSENYRDNQRVIIELPGVTDPEEAKSLIGEIPLLEFRLPKPQAEVDALVQARVDEAIEQTGNASTSVADIFNTLEIGDIYQPASLTGRYVDQASVANNPTTGEPTVLLSFDAEGTRLFGQLSSENIGTAMAIILDGEVISAPVLRQAIFDGNAEISGGFTLEEASGLAQNLSFGALPVPITPVSTQTISATLGSEVLTGGITAGAIGFALVVLFMLLFYRIGGVVAALALSFYMVLLIGLFKLFGVVFTAAGIAGLIISVGMAVDANILIFERIKEELAIGKQTKAAIEDGFARAWLSIRDSNISSILTAIILFYLTTSLVQGFALTFGIGVLVSMITAITVSRTLLLAIANNSKTFRKHLLGKITYRNN